MALVNALDIKALREAAVNLANRASYLVAPDEMDVRRTSADTEALVCALLAINMNLIILNKHQQDAATALDQSVPA